jgi:hypothetical protein
MTPLFWGYKSAYNLCNGTWHSRSLEFIFLVNGHSYLAQNKLFSYFLIVLLSGEGHS